MPQRKKTKKFEPSITICDKRGRRWEVDLTHAKAAMEVVEMFAHYPAAARRTLESGLHTLDKAVLVEERKAIVKKTLADLDRHEKEELAEFYHSQGSSPSRARSMARATIAARARKPR